MEVLAALKTPTSSSRKARACSDADDLSDSNILGSLDLQQRMCAGASRADSIGTAGSATSVAAAAAARTCSLGSRRSTSSTLALQRTGRCLAVGGSHLARGSLAFGRLLLMRVVVPVGAASGAAGQAALHAAGRALHASGCALARGAVGAARFARAQRVVLEDLDGETEPGLAVAPLSDLRGARLMLRDCRRVRVRVEYCHECVLVARDLEHVELLMVGCTRMKVVLLRCSGLTLREIQCSAGDDFVRRACPGFVHDIVCLRCACQRFGGLALSGSGGTTATAGTACAHHGGAGGSAGGARRRTAMSVVVPAEADDSDDERCSVSGHGATGSSCASTCHFGGGTVRA